MDENAHEVRRGGNRSRSPPPSSTSCGTSCSIPARAVQVADPRPRLALRLRRDGNVVETYVSYLRKKLEAARPTAHPHHAARRLHAPGAEPANGVGLSVAPHPTADRHRGHRPGRAGRGRRRHLLGAAARSSTSGSTSSLAQTHADLHRARLDQARDRSSVSVRSPGRFDGPAGVAAPGGSGSGSALANAFGLRSSRGADPTGKLVDGLSCPAYVGTPRLHRQLPSDHHRVHHPGRRFAGRLLHRRLDQERRTGVPGRGHSDRQRDLDG